MYGYLLEQEKYEVFIYLDTYYYYPRQDGSLCHKLLKDLEWRRVLQQLPDLPEFQLSLAPEDYRLPEIDPAWDSEKWETQEQPLKEHLKDFEDENAS